MTRDTKARIAVTLGGWLLSAIIQAFSFGYFFGALKQEVKDLGKRMDKIETHSDYQVRKEKTTEVNQ